MTDQPNQPSTYRVGIAIQSAVGDHAQVNNYLSTQAAERDPGVAELRRLFKEVNRRLDALDEADRELIKPAVQQAARAAAEIQQGDQSEPKQTFLEARLKAIYAMRRDIGEVIVVTLANPAAGIALALQKIAQKAQADLRPAEDKASPQQP